MEKRQNVIDSVSRRVLHDTQSMRIQAGRASTILPTVESVVVPGNRSRQSPHHTSTKTALLSARVVGLDDSVCVRSESTFKLVDGGLSFSLGSSMVEQALYKSQVAGSNPALATCCRPSSPMEEATNLKFVKARQ